ncbi:hypothetical protein XM53_00485 [Roseovarius atlanticus]|uniref:Primosomal protein N' (Replication factor Y)-superfamily II helicase n=1 Tax=Roseovarius atlanticus TaxID=1641875 RepID=A0A0T5NZH2_9RHOB|nr:hypothetical protein [Roseovarius atlanticus]KRS14252.1 hypothetical protein XM53_00485 [Roseovarius atlanticus]
MAGPVPGAQAVQAALRCPNCAGQCRYSPEAEGLACDSCGAVQRLETPDDHLARTEYGYDPDLPAEEPQSRPDLMEHGCEACGGRVIFTGPALSERCPYCDGPVVLADPDKGFDTMALIPFRVTLETAKARAQDWVRARIAAPSDLWAQVEDGHFSGLYAPFWTFDSKEALEYWAKYVTGSGKHRRTRSTSGSMKIHFDDLLVPASPHVTPLIRDGILHDFYPLRLRPYRAAYLAGFAAERHHQTVAEGLEANASDKRLLIRNRIKKHIDKRGVHDITYRTDTTGIHYRRILLPVWILHYAYDGTPKKIVVSGIDGRTFGERPLSRLKVMAYAAALSAVVIAFGLAWGAGGLL